MLRPFNTLDILRHATQFLSARYLSRALCAIRSLINARWLGPELYGFWGSLLLVVSFGFYLHGGVQDITVKDIPTHRSRGHGDRARHATQVSFTFFAVLLVALPAAQAVYVTAVGYGFGGVLRSWPKLNVVPRPQHADSDLLRQLRPAVA